MNKLRIVFVASEPTSWSVLSSLHAACVERARFSASILNVGFRGWLDFADDCSAYFQAKGIEFIDGYDDPVDVNDLGADIFVLADPYDQYRNEAYSIENLSRKARVVYIPYGADFAGRDGPLPAQLYGNDTIKKAWRVFTRAPDTIPFYERYSGISPEKVVPSGLPIFDNYRLSGGYDFLPSEFRSASPDTLKLIYAPHHSVDGWSTFLRNKDVIKRWIAENDCLMIFRPHPGLGPTLEAVSLMSRGEFDGFFDLENCFHYSGPDYYEIFKWSDILVTDASSFLVEYAPRRKPVIYTEKTDGWDIDDSIKPYVLDGYYRSRDSSELLSHLDLALSGSDPLLQRRLASQQSMSVGIFDGNAGQRIADYLLENW